MTKYNKDIDKLKSLDIRKILINNTKIIYRNNNKDHLLILKAITIKNEETTLNKITFNTGINILNIFNIQYSPLQNEPTPSTKKTKKHSK